MTGDWSLLVLAAILFVTAGRITLKAQSYKDTFARLGHSSWKLPAWGIRIFGIFLLVLGLLILYDFVRTLGIP